MGIEIRNEAKEANDFAADGNRKRKCHTEERLDHC